MNLSVCSALFQRGRSEDRMINLFKSFMKRPLSYDFLATNTQLKELLVRRISPALEAEGYQ